MARLGWERWTALGVCAFAVFYVVAFTTTGIDFDDTDRSVLAHYASGSARAKEVVAFFLIAAAALSLVVFGNGMRTARPRTRMVEPSRTRSRRRRAPSRSGYTTAGTRSRA